jgi:hypothetical protein
MGAPDPGKRQRRWAPKSRNGCLSCKARRLRCPDQTRPKCQRCIADGFECEWLPSSSKKSSPSRTLPTTSTDDSALVPTRYEPSSAWSSNLDFTYLQYFLQKVAPLLSTTKAWQNMWHITIPQSSWSHSSIRHAIIAAAASYEGRRAGVNQTDLALQRTNTAIAAFRKESTSTDATLILCRLLASVAQAQGDFATSASHMAWGARILRSASPGARDLSDVAKTMAPSFMASLVDSLVAEPLPVGFSIQQQEIWSTLVEIRSKFKSYYTVWLQRYWDGVERVLKGYLLTAWSILNQTMSAARHPNLVCFTKDDPVVLAHNVVAHLHSHGQFVDLNALSAAWDDLLEDLEALLTCTVDDPALRIALGNRVQLYTDNFMAHAFVFEPSMRAGTYWSSRPAPQCAVERRMEHLYNQLESKDALCFEETEDFSDISSIEMHNFYTENVCPYRSGILPNSRGDSIFLMATL